MYHYIRNYSPSLPFFNFLQKNNFDKQINYLKKKKIIKLKESFEDFINSDDKIFLSFDDGLKDHYFAFKKLLKLNLKGIFFVSSYPIIKKDFLDTHKVHLILGKFQFPEIMRAFQKFKININFNKIYSVNKNYQLKQAKNLEEKKKILIKIFLNFNIKNKNNKIINKLFNYFFLKKTQKQLFKKFYLNRAEIKEMFNSGMILGGHSYSHKLLGNMNYRDQKYEIEKNINHLTKIIGKKINFFAYPYGGKFSFNNNTIKILKDKKIKFSFNTGDKYIKSSKTLHNIPRFNCNKFRFGKIYKY